jgi:hypothetical protein
MALLLIVVPVWAYEEIAVTDGGTINGAVRITGGKPTPKAFNLITFPDPVYCGRISTGTGWRLLDEFTIGPNGGLKDAVVWLEDISKGKAFKFSPPTIEARDCQFTPFVNAVRDDDEVVIVNMDPVMHDIQAYETSQLGPRVLFNSPLPMNPHHKRNVTAHSHEHLAGEPMKETINLTKNRRIFVMQCGFHAYMVSWGMAMEHPYYAVTGSDGDFTIGEVPPGDYRLMAWHPETGPTLERQITIPAKGTTNASFEFRTPKGRRSVHEMVENPHYGMEALGKPLEIIPTLKRQTP